MTNTYYDTDFRNLDTPNAEFPSINTSHRNIKYNFYNSLYSGDYGKDKKLVIMTDNGKKQRELPYKQISTNYFKLMINKIESIVFSNDYVISTGNKENDRIIRDLFERTCVYDAIRQGIKNICAYGDNVYRVNRHGINALLPINAYKVVDKHDKNRVKAYVLYEYLYDDTTFSTETVVAIRVEIHSAGRIYERVYRSSGSTLIEPIEYEYRGRTIKEDGNVYYTGVDISTVTWASINNDADGIYGESLFEDIKDLVFAYEQLLTTSVYVARSDANPLLVTGMSFIQTNEETGEYTLKIVDGDVILASGDDAKPEYLKKSDSISNISKINDEILGQIYAMSEMSKVLLSGEFGSNLSYDTLDLALKSIIDKCERIINSAWTSIRDALYVLCRLNGVDINREDLNIKFNVGRAVSAQDRYKQFNEATKDGAVSKRTARIEILGMSDDEADNEADIIKKEA